jgi:hypothetical protein
MTIPNTFADKTISVSLEDLDNNFSYIESAIAALSTLSTLNVQTTLTVANTIVISQTSINNVQTINVATINVSNGVTISNNITISNNLTTSNISISNTLNVSNTIIISNGIINVSNSIVTTNLITSNITARDIVLSNNALLPISNGSIELFKNGFYATQDITQGRGVIPVTHYTRLTANGSTISTSIVEWFPNKRVILSPDSIYLYDYHLYFKKGSTGGVVYFFFNLASGFSAVRHIHFTAQGIQGSANFSSGTFVGGFSIATADGSTGALNFNVTSNNFCYVNLKAIVSSNATNASSIWLGSYNLTGDYLPYIGSYFTVQRLPKDEIGTFYS